MFNLLYVYRKNGSRVLICKTGKTQLYRAEKDILGWVDTVFLQFWPGGRLCLDVNHKAEAVKARKEANLKAGLFLSREAVPCVERRKCF